MGNTAAIVARLGLDQSDFKNGMRSAYQEAVKNGKAISSAMGGNGEKGGWLEGDKKVERNAVSLVKELTTAKSIGEGVAKTVDKVANALQLPLGVAIGIGAAVEGYNALAEALQKVQNANTAARAELEKPIEFQITMGQPAIDAIDKAFDDIEKSRTFMAAFADYYNTLFNPKGGDLSKGIDLQVELVNRKAKISAQVAESTRQEMADKQDAAKYSEAEVKIVQLRYETERKIAAIRANDKMMPDQKLAMIDKEAAARDDAIAALRKGDDSKWMEITAAERLNATRRIGNNEDVEAAKVKLELAERQARLAESQQEKAIAKNQLAAAQLAVAEAEKAAALKKDELELEKKIAALVAPSSVKALEAAKGKLAILEKQTAVATPDKKAQLDVEIAKQKEALKRITTDAKLKAAQTAEDKIVAETGRGEAERLKALEKRIKLTVQNIAVLKALQSTEDGQRASEEAKLKTLQNEAADIWESRQKAAKEASVESQAMDLELKGQKQKADALRRNAEFERKIAEARKDGNEELAKALEKQKQIANQQQAQNIAKERKERVQLSLGELASEGRGKVRSEARKAQKEEERARKAALRGDMEGAKQHMDKADAIKRRIDPLRESEKRMKDDFKGAMDEAKVLKDIEANTRKMGGVAL